jgi:hypothetical protein
LKIKPSKDERENDEDTIDETTRFFLMRFLDMMWGAWGAFTQENWEYMIGWIIGNKAMNWGFTGWIELAGKADGVSVELCGMRRRTTMMYRWTRNDWVIAQMYGLLGACM